ncbi:MAG TPA: sulfurtransferase TusA family protein [bacterium]|nr:sulfurtransferase TusA family protein [bacterium]
MEERPETGQAGPVEDARGLLCPLPVVRLGRRVAAVEPGTEVLLLADDPMAAEDVRLWAAGAGHELLRVEEEDDGTLRITVRKAPAG